MQTKMNKKRKFKVTASMITDLYAIVEAENENDAMELAENWSENYTWQEDGGWMSGDFRIDDAKEVQ